MSVGADQFRDVMGRFASGVTVVTTADSNGYAGFTASSFSSVSLDPPLVLVCLGRDAACYPSFVGGTGFAVNILAENQADLSVRFSSDVGDRFVGVKYDTWVTGAPILDGVLAAIDCRLHAVHDGGDHAILVGRVERLGPVAAETGPLLYYRGAYQTLG